ncbi:MAG: prepilin-type N-terminal cleavage/methylation domain-containing protein, partial [Gammaproteobacteria bacterium]
MNYQRKKQGGFTLIEVMVVVMILGILAAIVVPRIVSRPEEAKIVKAKQDIARLEAGLDLY